MPKKTQRDKDWPMVRRLVEAHYFQNRQTPSPPQVDFWLGEMRSPELLVEVARDHERVCEKAASSRELLVHALDGNVQSLTDALKEEEAHERERDRTYWIPLKKELEKLRHEARGKR